MKKVLAIAAVMLLGSSGAWAAGTAAGTTITNDASLTYSVSSAAGSQEISVEATKPDGQHADTFVVDKKIDFVLTHEDDPKHLSVVPDQDDAVRHFKLKNEGNKKQDFTLVATDLTNSEEYDSKTDVKDTESNTFEYSLNGTDWASDLTVTNLDPDHEQDIYVRADIPASPTVADGDVINIQLEATAVQEGTTTAEKNTGTDNNAQDGGADRKTTEDTILAEGAPTPATGNTAFDGKYSAWAGYIVEAPELHLAKTSCVYDDYVNTTKAHSKRIPGATLFYVFDIENTGSKDATSVTLSDDISDDLTTAALDRVWKGTTSACECNNGENHGDEAVANGGADDTSNVNASTDAATNEITISDVSVTAATHTCIAVKADII